MAQIFWHNLSVKEISKLLGVNLEKGLSDKEVYSIREKIGENKLPEEKPLSKWKLVLEQFQNPLIFILLLAGIITIILKEIADSIVIFGAVFLNTFVGYFQENKASKALSELRKIVKYEARVLRDGIIKIIDSAEIVPGDIILLNPGEKVPADARIIESHNLKTNEMSLTGEWLPAQKKEEVVNKETTLADRDNMVYMGTIVEDGKGKAIVVETGLTTEIGRVAVMVKETKEEKTPLQKRLTNFSRLIGIIVSIIAVLIFIEGILTGNSFIDMFTTAIAVAVAAIPEGLPVALTVILALGMQRILKRKGLVKRLLAAETLGSTSVIASDKTCTLTEGKMKVSEVFAIDGKKSTQKQVVKVIALCNEAFVENPKEAKENWVLAGRPTDKALLAEAIEWGISSNEIEKKEERINEITFDSVRKYAASLHKISEKKLNLYVMGAPEKLISFSKLDKKEIEKINKKLEELTGKGYRVVAAAEKTISRELEENEKMENEIKDLKFVGLVAMKDPLRKDARETVNQVIKAGIRLIIVTGDHKLTVKNVAEDLGMKINEENIIEGKDLDLLTDKELDERIKDIKVYARVEPKHKIRIVGAWQRRGDVVAMTGDGINDAPALKKADIGISIGSGTEVAKETSDLVLLNDSFSIIVAAIEEGRSVMDNIRKVMTYLLSDSFSEVVLIAGALLAGFPLPILPVQILWVNLVEDGLPDIALALEPKEKDLMDRKPEGNKAPLLTGEMKSIIFIIGLFTDLILLGLFFWLHYHDHNIDHIRTMIFATLGIDSMFYVFSCKSLRRNIWHINIFSNKFLVGAVVIGLMMLVLAIYLPPLQNLLSTTPLVFADWLIVLGLGLLNILLIEATKWYFIVRHKT
ncbi:MAG: HAD-IC family P-type ATPase [Candidatus Nealsonbacteria bacterium]